ncbi:pitrilysin family protein [Magnetospira sp. QH-2]|uniref:M16 family metallopeptidase n=1 Tax=Magnetospira sp. (strain QH-2) TaxID=1288970 RepID=UPI0005FA8351|nr:pitrilysin family protein [Magnetospira sp. QH-2]
MRLLPFLSLFALLISVTDSVAGIFNPQTDTLENGLQVVVVPNHRAPVVTHMVWYRVGRADEPPGKGGLSHLLEHLMFKGTENYAPNEMSQIVARNGGRENAFTSYDYTAYYQTVASDRLGLMMAMEADRMGGLTLSAPIIEPERQVVLEERRQRVGNRPSAQLHEAASPAFYINHPYGQPIIGWEQEIESITLQDIMSHYERWYCPANAILIVAGDVTMDDVLPLAEKHYGPKACTAPPPERVRPPSPVLEAERRIILRDANAGQTRWSRTYPAPSFATGEVIRTHALSVLDELLSGGATSRLYRSLVMEKSLATSVSSHYDGDSLDRTGFALSAQLNRGTDPDRLEAAFQEQISKLLNDGVTDEEVARAKQRMLDSAIYARESLRTAAHMFGVALTTGQTIEDVESWPKRIAEVTRQDVEEAAQAVFDQPGHVTAILLDMEE